MSSHCSRYPSCGCPVEIGVKCHLPEGTETKEDFQKIFNDVVAEIEGLPEKDNETYSKQQPEPNLKYCKEHNILAFKTTGDGEYACYKCYGMSWADYKKHYPEFADVHKKHDKEKSFSKNLSSVFAAKRLKEKALKENN